VEERRWFKYLNLRGHSQVVWMLFFTVKIIPYSEISKNKSIRDKRLTSFSLSWIIYTVVYKYAATHKIRISEKRTAYC
jgi:hypothetical protein